MCARPPSIRRASPDEAAILSELAFRSKAHWGYDAAFMEACRADLTVTPEDVTAQPYFVAAQDGLPLGFYSLRSAEGGARLDHLFVAPEAIGQGLGKMLWRHLLDEARRAGHPCLLIDSDPYAEAFYLGQGARRVGVTPSTVFPDRQLPLLRFDLNAQNRSSSIR